jgi:hypothetical protein
MNQKQRNELKSLLATAAMLREKMFDVLSAVTDITDVEREKYDNMPESLQSSERGEKMSEDADALESAAQTLESALDDIESALSELDDVASL